MGIVLMMMVMMMVMKGGRGRRIARVVTVLPAFTRRLQLPVLAFTALPRAGTSWTHLTAGSLRPREKGLSQATW